MPADRPSLTPIVCSSSSRLIQTNSPIDDDDNNIIFTSALALCTQTKRTEDGMRWGLDEQQPRAQVLWEWLSHVIFVNFMKRNESWEMMVMMMLMVCGAAWQRVFVDGIQIVIQWTVEDRVSDWYDWVIQVGFAILIWTSINNRDFGEEIDHGVCTTTCRSSADDKDEGKREKARGCVTTNFSGNNGWLRLSGWQGGGWVDKEAEAGFSGHSVLKTR